MHKSFRLIYVLLALTFMLAACGPSAQPTQSPQEVADQVSTSVAMTIEAQGQIATTVALTVDAQQAMEAAQATPTAVQPLPTLTPILPTATPFVIVPTTSSSGSSGGSSGSSSSSSSSSSTQYDCTLTNQKPYDGVKVKPGDPIDVYWTLKNTGTKTWAASFPWYYFKGTNMSPTAGSTLGEEVKPGKSITKMIEVTAPAINNGEDHQIFVMWWTIEAYGSRFCQPYISVDVWKPGSQP